MANELAEYAKTPATTPTPPVVEPEQDPPSPSVKSQLQLNCTKNPADKLNVKTVASKERLIPRFDLQPPVLKRFSNLLEKQAFKDQENKFNNSSGLYREELRSQKVEAAEKERISHALTKACGNFGGLNPLPEKRAEIVRALLGECSKLDIDLFTCKFKRNALHHCVRTRAFEDAVDCVELLISSALFDIDLKDTTGRSPLVMVCERKQISWEKTNRIRVNSNSSQGGAGGGEGEGEGEGEGGGEGEGEKEKEGEGESEDKIKPHYGARVASCLLVAGADVNTKDSENSTPLHHAVRNNDIAMCESLLKHKPDLALRDNRHLTTLQTAATLDFNEVLLALLKAGADVEETFVGGDSLLLYFARRGLSKNVKLVLEYSAKNVKNLFTHENAADLALKIDLKTSQVLAFHNYLVSGLNEEEEVEAEDVEEVVEKKKKGKRLPSKLLFGGGGGLKSRLFCCKRGGGGGGAPISTEKLE